MKFLIDFCFTFYFVWVHPGERMALGNGEMALLLGYYPQRVLVLGCCCLTLPLCCLKDCL